MFGKKKENTEQTEKRSERKNAETMKKDGQEVCPCCDRHCPVDRLHCANGKKHFGLPVEENEERGHGGKGDGRGAGANGHGSERHDGKGDRHGAGTDGHGSERHGSRGDGHGTRTDGHGLERHGGREHGMKQIDESGMSSSEITYALLRRCGHALHHASGEESPDTMFAALSEEERKELNDLLRKVLKSWQRD